MPKRSRKTCSKRTSVYVFKHLQQGGYAVLVMENMNSQLIYYVSKKFSPVENKYIEIQKYLFAVIMVARMLRLYVLLHPQNDGPNRKTTQILPTKVGFFRNNGKAKDRTQ